MIPLRYHFRFFAFGLNTMSNEIEIYGICDIFEGKKVSAQAM